jgi:protein involved in temperature-dependent protein secretion
MKLCRRCTGHHCFLACVYSIVEKLSKALFNLKLSLDTLLTSWLQAEPRFTTIGSRIIVSDANSIDCHELAEMVFQASVKYPAIKR